MTNPHRFRLVVGAIAAAAALAMAVPQADARAGGGRSMGSRGMSTFSTPRATPTAPRAAPIERSITQPGIGGPRAAAPAAQARPGLFGRPGLMSGLLGGLVGAGLFGLLFGHGMFGGLGGLASMFGLLLQLGLIVLVARFAWSWWQRRNRPAYAGMDNRPAGTSVPPTGPAHYQAAGGAGDATGRSGDAIGLGTAAASAPLSPTQADFDAFEALLGTVQTAYGREDLAVLRQHVTAEMLSYFAEELTANTSRGVVNRVSDVKLLQGDLSEAWREGQTDYATVAMRYSLRDHTEDRATGRVVDGDRDHPTEATELWTFRRAAGGGAWLLSAIQQS